MQRMLVFAAFVFDNKVRCHYSILAYSKAQGQTMNQKKNNLLSFLRENIRRADVLLLVLFIVIGLAMTLLTAGFSSSGQKVVISVGGKEYGTYRLSVDRTITIRQKGHVNKVRIRDGRVSMVYSDCRNQICVHHHAIDKTSQQIVCLPNQVMLRIEGKDSDDTIDAVSGN